MRAVVRAAHERVWFKNASPRQIPVRVRRVREFSIDPIKLVTSARVACVMLDSHFPLLATQEKRTLAW